MPAFGASSSSPAFGASSSSFGDEVYLRYVVKVLVLSPTPAVGATRCPFSFGSTPAFSQSTPTFGSIPFGSRATTPAFGSAGFGQTSFGGQHLGSRVTPYAQTPEADCSSGTHPAGKLLSISAMPAHKEKSHEEFRREDYQLGDKGGPNPAGQFSGGMSFNTNNTQSNPFSSSPAFSHLSANPFSCSNPFAQKTATFNTPGFGSSTPSLGSLPFGASAYNPFGSTPAPIPSVFGASSTPAFGPSPTPAFGTTSSFSFGSIPEFSESTTPGFGSAGFVETSRRGTRRGSSINSYADSGNSVTQPAEKLESISAMPAYKKKSHEELRWEHYQLVDKVGQATTPALSFGGQHGGDRVTPYAQTPEADIGSGTHPAGKLVSISAMLAYKEKNHEELRWEDYQLGHKGGPNPAGQSSGGMGFNTNNTQSNRSSFPPAFSQLSANPFSSSKSSNPFAQKTPTFSTSGFGSSTPSVFGSTPGFAATTSASFFGTPRSSPFGTSKSIFGTTQAQGATPSFATGLNFSNTQSSPLFQSSTPSLGQTSSPFGQSTPAFGQSNAFGVNLFSSTPSILSTSSMGFNQTTPSLSMPFQSAQPTQNSGGFRFAAPAGNHSENILNEDHIDALMPKLHRSDYYTEPRIQELAARERVEPGSCRRVKDFVVGRHGCGSIKFLGETDVRHLDLESIVQFNHLKVTVYMDDNQKPPVGQGLNKPAEVTLLNVRLYDEQTGRLLTEGPRIEKYKDMLNKIAEDQGGESVSYDPIKGEWKFRVNHFRK